MKESLESFRFGTLKRGCFNPSTLVTTSHQIQIKDINNMIKNYLEKLVLMLQKLSFKSNLRISCLKSCNFYFQMHFQYVSAQRID